jgi:hypothetical protein
MKLYFILILLVLSACSTGVSLKKVPFGPIFHDNGSKVWMIDEVITNGKNYAPIENTDKDVMVFYDSGVCMFQPMKSLGEIQGRKGEYSIYSEEGTLSIFFKNERWDFTIKSINETRIELIPLKKSAFKYALVLIPFPEI